MRQRLGIRHLQPPVSVRHGPVITRVQVVVLNFSLQVVQLRIHRSALLVVIDLPIRKQHMLDTEIKNIGIALLLRYLRFRNVAAAVLVADEVNHGMLDHNLIKIYLVMKQGDNLKIDRQPVERE